MLECWRHSAARRPSFRQLLDELVPDLSDEFRNVSYYFSHDPDTDDATAADSDSANSRNASVDDLTGEAVPFRTASATEPMDSVVDRKISDISNMDQNELQLSGFVRQSSADRNPRNPAEFIEMSSPPNTTIMTDPQAGHCHTGDDKFPNSRQGSGETAGASCRNDAHTVAEYDGKDSSGSSLGSRKNGLINGHVIPFGGVLSSEVHWRAGPMFTIMPQERASFPDKHVGVIYVELTF